MSQGFTSPPKTTSTNVASSALTDYDLWPFVCQGRMTLTSGTPVTTTDVSGAITDVYFTSYKGNRIALYNTTTNLWNHVEFTEKSLTLPANADANHDIWGYLSGGDLALDQTAWASATARNVAIVLQDGVYVKDGAAQYRYLGTVRTTANAGQTEDSETKRFVWNYYNRVSRKLRKLEGTDSWTYATQTWRPANNNSANSFNIVCGVAEDTITVNVSVMATPSGANFVYSFTGIGVNSTTAVSDMTVESGAIQYMFITNIVNYTETPRIGFSTYYWLEAAAQGTITFYGDAGDTTIYHQSGMVGAFLM